LRCEAAADDAARNSQVRDAYRHFSGLAEEDISPWLEQIASWRAAATDAEPVRSEKDNPNGLGSDLESRRHFERMLHCYGEGDLDGCLMILGESQSVGDRRQFERLRQQSEPYLLELLEDKLIHINTQWPGRAGIDELREAQTLLDRSSFLRDSSRWKLLDSSLRHQATMAAKAVAK
jgi:hypothetical protein